MSYAKRSRMERLLIIHGVPFRHYGRLLVLDCGTDRDGNTYARWVPCPGTERELYSWLGY